MNASPRELKARYRAAKGVLSLLQKMTSATKRVGVGNHPFFAATANDLQRSHDKAAAKLEAWRKRHGVELEVKRPAGAAKKRGASALAKKDRRPSRGSRA